MSARARNGQVYADGGGMRMPDWLRWLGSVVGWAACRSTRTPSHAGRDDHMELRAPRPRCTPPVDRWLAHRPLLRAGGILVRSTAQHRSRPRVGAVTAGLGFLIVDLAAMFYAAATEAWPMPLAWLAFGFIFTIPVAFLGGLWAPGSVDE